MNRNQIQQVIDSNIFDNVNKEILASMVRTVFEEIKDSYFNLDEDEARNVNYNSTQTLQQVFDTLPAIQKGVIGPFDPKVVGSVNVSGSFLEDAELASISGLDSKMIINFAAGQDISSKTFFFSHFTDASGDVGLNLHNDIVTPVYRIQTSTQLNLGYRALNNDGVRDRHFLNIFMI